MCQSKADGGKRCLAHSFEDYNKVRDELAATDKPSNAKENRYIKHVDSMAQHDQGVDFLLDRAAAIRNGAPLKGDRLPVIEAAVSRAVARRAAEILAEDVAREEREAQRDRASAALAQALATGRPMPDDLKDVPLSTRRPVAPCTTPIERALGERMGTKSAPLPGSDDGGPVAPWSYGTVTVQGRQRSLVERWGAEPVEVRARRDFPANNGTDWNAYDPRAGSWLPLAADDRRPDEATLVVTRVSTGERVGLRATRGRDGVWTIQGEQR